LKSIVRIGERLPLHRGATGLVFMAALPEQKLATVLDQLPEELVPRRELLREQMSGGVLPHHHGSHQSLSRPRT